MFYAFTSMAQNLILNGSFEINNMTQCYEDLHSWTSSPFNNYDSIIPYSSSYGAAIVIMKGSCERCNPPTFWGGGTQEGVWMAGLASKPFTSPLGNGWNQSKFSFELDHPLSTGKNYKLTFYIKEPPDIPLNSTGCLESPSNYVNIGISNTDTAFGTHIYTSPLGDTIWKQYSIVFNTQNAEEFITVKVGVNDTIDYAVLIDNFVLEETTEPLTTGVNELNSKNRKLLKIVDVLGKESKSKNGLLFYIYSDGTVEKKLIIE
jgi:hypothetical protein